MVNDNGRTLWVILRDMIQYALIPLLVVMWTVIDKGISENAATLKRVESNQIRVMVELNTLRGDLTDHEDKQTRESIERGRFHHTSRTSCIDCKIPGRDVYPYPQSKNKKPGPFNNEK